MRDWCQRKIWTRGGGSVRWWPTTRLTMGISATKNASVSRPSRSQKSSWQDLNLRPPRPERGSGPAEFATILLPNCSVRSRTGKHQGVSLCSIIVDLLDALLRIGTRGYRRRRISSAVLSTTQPPLQYFDQACYFASGASGWGKHRTH